MRREPEVDSCSRPRDPQVVLGSKFRTEAFDRVLSVIVTNDAHRCVRGSLTREAV
jgi:hypothetical protein